MTKKIILGVLVILVIYLIYVIAKPSPINPALFNPPEKIKLTGVLQPNNLLGKAELLAQGKIYGPEDVAVDDRGRVYGGTQDGKILRMLSDGAIETFAITGGRPLGLHFDKDDNLIVCDADRGLLSIDTTGEITTLAAKKGAVSIWLADDLDIARDGTIYFSDASDKYFLGEYLYDLLEAKPYGRLLSYYPRTKEIKVLLEGLYFANGVALSTNEDFVLVNETYRYRITRYWLKGPKAGASDIFIDNLPGFPDGVSANRKGTFWVALFTVRNDVMDWLHPHAFLKSLLAKLPKFLWPKPYPYGLVLALDEKGNIIQSIHDPTGKHLPEITSAQEHEGYLYLGTLSGDRIGKYMLPD